MNLEKNIQHEWSLFYLTGAVSAPNGSKAREAESLLAATHLWLSTHLEQSDFIWRIYKSNTKALRTYLGHDKSLVSFCKL
jgi:hypothetical protein